MRSIIVVAVGFAVSHLLFWLLAFGAPDQRLEAQSYFQETQLGGPLLPAFATLFASVILAPVCEELLYRGATLRPIHDSMARRGSATVAAVVAILISSAAFALPHLGGELLSRQGLAFMITGITFGLVYVLTGSMTAAMVAHSLQSCFSFGQTLYFGRGDADVHPILWILVLGCPLWVYLVARALRAVFPAPATPTTPAS